MGFSTLGESLQLKTFQAQVRVVLDGASAVVATELQALNVSQAKAIMCRLFGKTGIISVFELRQRN